MFFRPQHHRREIDDSLRVVHEKDKPIVTGALAVVALPDLSLEGFDVPTEWVFFHLTDTAEDLPSDFIRQFVDELLGVVRYPNDLIHVLRHATA